MCSTTTNRRSLAAFDFASVSGFNQLIVDPTQARFEIFDLLTEVPDLVWVGVVAPICNSDHSFLSAVISMDHAVSNSCVSGIVFL